MRRTIWFLRYLLPRVITVYSRSLFCLFFLIHFVALCQSPVPVSLSKRSKTLISKNAHWPVTQKLTALTSSVASFHRLPNYSRICSPSNSASIGSTLTSLLFHFAGWQWCFWLHCGERVRADGSGPHIPVIEHQMQCFKLFKKYDVLGTVSYTHLTLPTILLV